MTAIVVVATNFFVNFFVGFAGMTMTRGRDPIVRRDSIAIVVEQRVIL